MLGKASLQEQTCSLFCAATSTNGPYYIMVALTLLMLMKEMGEKC